MNDHRTKLKDKISIASIARKAGVTYPWLYSVLAGRNKPSIRLARKIERITGGLIRWEDFFPYPPQIPKD